MKLSSYCVLSTVVFSNILINIYVYVASHLLLELNICVYKYFLQVSSDCNKWRKLFGKTNKELNKLLTKESNTPISKMVTCASGLTWSLCSWKGRRHSWFMRCIHLSKGTGSHVADTDLTRYSGSLVSKPIQEGLQSLLEAAF